MTGELRDTVVLEHVSRRFGRVVAIDDLSVEFRASDGVTGIIGPNGSGKTTLVNVATGFLRPSGGRVSLSGRDIGGVRPHRLPKLGLARTFQESMVFGAMTIEENIVVALERSGRHRSEVRAVLAEDQTYEILWEQRRQRAADTPFGLARILGIVMATASNPRVLFLDEPSAGLNNVESEHLGRAIGRLPDRGIGTIVIDHDMRFLLPLCGRVVALDAGVVIADGTAAEVRADPRVIAVYLGEAYA